MKTSFTLNSRCLLVLAVASAAGLAGCASTSAGPQISLGLGPNTQQLDSLRQDLASGAKSTAAQNAVSAAVAPQAMRSGFLVIGDVFPLYRYSGDQAARQYAMLHDPKSAVHKQFEALVGTPEPYTEAQFAQRYEGWSSIIYDSVPLVFARNISGLVPRSLDGAVDYPNRFMSFEFGTTGDRVLGCSTPWGLVEISRVLCHGKGDDASCRAKYPRGVYSVATGERVKNDLSGLDPKGKPLALSALGPAKGLCTWNAAS